MVKGVLGQKVGWFQAVDLQVGLVRLLCGVIACRQSDLAFALCEQKVGAVFLALQSRFSFQLHYRKVIARTFGFGQHAEDEIEVPGLCVQLEFTRTADTVCHGFHLSCDIHIEDTGQLAFQLAQP